MIKKLTSVFHATRTAKRVVAGGLAQEKLKKRVETRADFARNSKTSRLGKAALTGEALRTPTQVALLAIPLENVQMLDAPAALQLKTRVTAELDPFSADNVAHTNAWLMPQNVRQRYAALFTPAAKGLTDSTAPVWSFTGLVRDGLGAASNGKPDVAAQRFKGALNKLNEVHRVGDAAKFAPEVTWAKVVERAPQLAEALQPQGLSHLQRLQDSLLKLMALSINADRLINGAATPSRAAAARSFEAERSLAVRFGSDTIGRLMALKVELDKHLAKVSPATPPAPELW